MKEDTVFCTPTEPDDGNIDVFLAIYLLSYSI